MSVLSGERQPRALRDLRLPSGSAPVLEDDDVQLTLWVLYELHYRGFDGIHDHEWDPDVIAVRRQLENRFEA